ncbi:MAG TPA: acyloxyacyl hydrolase [Verrucomicrobiae bacterium]|nr:acyloxyacyl hydrolase [Verrucomicrobiae bacterium]
MTGLCGAQQFNLESAGGRFGFYPFGAGSHFYQAEAFADWALPWNWDLGSHWLLRSRFDSSLGWLGEADANAAIGSLGPTLVFARENLPVTFEGGVSATGLSRSDFRDKNFGDLFQFTSHVGLNFDMAARFRLSYRFQHMSNAGLSSHNPGLNMHMFGMSYVF